MRTIGRISVLEDEVITELFPCASNLTVEPIVARMDAEHNRGDLLGQIDPGIMASDVCTFVNQNVAKALRRGGRRQSAAMHVITVTCAIMIMPNSCM